MSQINLKFLIPCVFIFTLALTTSVKADGSIGLCYVSVGIPHTADSLSFSFKKHFMSRQKCLSVIPVLCQSEYLTHTIKKYRETRGWGVDGNFSDDFYSKGGKSAAKWGCISEDMKEPQLDPSHEYREVNAPRQNPIQPWRDNYKSIPRIKPVPIPSPLPNLKFTPLDILKCLWNLCVEKFWEIDVQTWLALIAVFVGLGLLKSGEFAISGPGALEPLSAMAAIALLLVLLDPYMTDAEKKKYKNIDTTSVEIIDETQHHLVYVSKDVRYELLKDAQGQYVFHLDEVLTEDSINTED